MKISKIILILGVLSLFLSSCYNPFQDIGYFAGKGIHEATDGELKDMTDKDIDKLGYRDNVKEGIKALRNNYHETDWRCVFGAEVPMYCIAEGKCTNTLGEEETITTIIERMGSPTVFYFKDHPVTM